MEVFARGENLLCTGVQDFSLTDTLCCGQCFRWDETAPNTFFGVVGNKTLLIAQDGDTLVLNNTTLEDWNTLWRDYFDLSRDYAAIKKTFCGDEVLSLAMQFAPGMRVLRQPAWETLCSFIISQNNNIKRIKGIVSRLCETYGERLSGDAYTFPAPEVLAGLTEQDLAPLRAGFRAQYILDAARKVASGEVNLNELYTIEMDKARQSLIRIKGVGAKVADCALLYGFSRVEAFPLDVWMKRAMAEFFPQGLPCCAGEYAGIAQQYLFHYVRCCPTALPEKAG